MVSIHFVFPAFRAPTIILTPGLNTRWLRLSLPAALEISFMTTVRAMLFDHLAEFRPPDLIFEDLVDQFLEGANRFLPKNSLDLTHVCDQLCEGHLSFSRPERILVQAR